MYAPNVYTLDLEQMMTGGASLTAAAGVVQLTIYNAKDIKNSELVGHSDPYIKIRLGNRPEIASTQVQKNTYVSSLRFDYVFPCPFCFPLLHFGSY